MNDVSHHEGFDDAYIMYGIGKREGCLVVYRPDRHMGYVSALKDVNGIEKF